MVWPSGLPSQALSRIAPLILLGLMAPALVGAFGAFQPFSPLLQSTISSQPMKCGARVARSGGFFGCSVLPTAEEGMTLRQMSDLGSTGLRMARQAGRKGRRNRRDFSPEDFTNSGPVGKAKKKILYQADKKEALREESWDALKEKLQDGTEEYPEGWAWGADDLAKKKAAWNVDLTDDQDTTEDLVEETSDPDWKQVTDPSTGDVYFWNMRTDETTWDLPKGVDPTSPDVLSDFRGLTMTIADPSGQPGSKWLCTQRTTGHAHHGIFFDVEAKDEDIYITGVRTAAHYKSMMTEARYRILVHDETSYGNENSKKGWTQIGFKRVQPNVVSKGPKRWDALGLSRDLKSFMDKSHEFLPQITPEDEDPETIYGALPLREAIHVGECWQVASPEEINLLTALHTKQIPAGKRIGICIWNDEDLGIVLRKKDPFTGSGRFRRDRYIGGYFEKDEVTDENADMTIRAGLVPRYDVFRSVLNPEGYMGFAGVLRYVLKPQNVPEFSELDEDYDEDFGNEIQSSDTSDQAAANMEEVPQEEMDPEDLKDGPAENFFGGGSGADETTGNLISFAVFKGEADLGDVEVNEDCTFELFQIELQELSGSASNFKYENPDGSGPVEVNDSKAFEQMKSYMLDQQWGLEGFMEIDLL